MNSPRSHRRLRLRLQTLLCSVLGLALLAAPRASQAQTTTLFGALSNFDVLNDTGEETHGFEIEIDGITSQDIGGTFGSNRYGAPTIVPFAGGVYVRYLSAYDPDTQQFATGTPVATNFTATTGHQCISLYPAYQTSGCDHFGVWLGASQATNTTYRWLIADPQTPGALMPFGVPVSIPAPVWTVVPQGGAGAVVAAEIHPPRPPRPELQFGDAQWVKIFKTELERDVDLDELVTGNAVVPEDAAETETEWKLLQHNPHSANSGALKNQGKLGGGSHAVIRRYEFYKYTGQYDPVDHEAVCGGDGSCNAPLDGELGDYIGAQMAAANLGAPAAETPTNTATPTSAAAPPTSTPTATATTGEPATPAATFTSTPTASTSPTPTPIACTGDCNTDQSVTVDELVKGVTIALGTASLDQCPVFDCNATGVVTVDCLIKGVNAALNGCAPL
jgi:hypothetical protein